MTTTFKALDIAGCAAHFVPPGVATTDSRPVWLVRPADLGAPIETLPVSPAQRAWLVATGFKAGSGRHALVPGPDGQLAGVVLGLGADSGKPPPEPVETLVGTLPGLLPPGDYHLASKFGDMALAAVAWGLGSYRFDRYRSNATPADQLPRLRLPEGVDRDRVVAEVAALSLGRNLINTPANDMGPDELEAAALDLAREHGATARSVVGEALLAENFPLIHAVGRASPRQPRLIDLVAGRADAPKVTIVGKGICFDTGGLDLKPPSAMLLMKKDMGGAAAAMALAHMVLASGLDVRLRLLLAVAENSVDGSAFRPGDVIRSRAGHTVEIGNTDAEGRLVLADALALADEEAPEHLFTFATLTGAARVALGPDIMPFYSENQAFAASLVETGDRIGDPVWPMPVRTPYDNWIDSRVADMNNIAEGGFAGSIVAAIFLKRFVAKARHFAHFDIYGWRPRPKPLGQKGGETQAARAVFEVLSQQYGRRSSEAGSA